MTRGVAWQMLILTERNLDLVLKGDPGTVGEAAVELVQLCNLEAVG